MLTFIELLRGIDLKSHFKGGNFRKMKLSRFSRYWPKFAKVFSEKFPKVCSREIS